MANNKNAVSLLEEYFSGGTITKKVTYNDAVNMTPNTGKASFRCVAMYGDLKFTGFGPDKKLAKVAVAENVLKHVNNLMNQKRPPKKQASSSENWQRQDSKHEPKQGVSSSSSRNHVPVQNGWEQQGEYFNPHAAEEYNQNQWDAPVEFAQSGLYYPEDHYKMPISVYVYGPDIGPLDTISKSEPHKQLNVFGVTSDQRHVEMYKTVIWRVVPAGSARETFCAFVFDQMNRWQFSTRHVVQASPETLAVLENVRSALCFCGFEWAPINAEKE